MRSPRVPKGMRKGSRVFTRGSPDSRSGHIKAPHLKEPTMFETKGVSEPHLKESSMKQSEVREPLMNHKEMDDPELNTYHNEKIDSLEQETVLGKIQNQGTIFDSIQRQNDFDRKRAEGLSTEYQEPGNLMIKKSKKSSRPMASGNLLNPEGVKKLESTISNEIKEGKAQAKKTFSESRRELSGAKQIATAPSGSLTGTKFGPTSVESVTDKERSGLKVGVKKLIGKDLSREEVKFELEKEKSPKSVAGEVSEKVLGKLEDQYPGKEVKQKSTTALISEEKARAEMVAAGASKKQMKKQMKESNKASREEEYKNRLILKESMRQINQDKIQKEKDERADIREKKRLAKQAEKALSSEYKKGSGTVSSALTDLEKEEQLKENKKEKELTTELKTEVMEAALVDAHVDPSFTYAKNQATRELYFEKWYNSRNIPYTKSDLLKLGKLSLTWGSQEDIKDIPKYELRDGIEASGDIAVLMKKDSTAERKIPKDVLLKALQKTKEDSAKRTKDVPDTRTDAQKKTDEKKAEKLIDIILKRRTAIQKAKLYRKNKKLTPTENITLSEKEIKEDLLSSNKGDVNG
jgi:hypothetical protein